MPSMRVWIVLLLLAGGCASHIPPTIVTPAGKVAYTADSVQIRITELQNTAIQAEATNALPTATARLIIQFTVSASRTLKATPTGWIGTISTAWADVKMQLGPQTNPAIAAAMGAVDAVLAAVGQGGA